MNGKKRLALGATTLGAAILINLSGVGNAVAACGCWGDAMAIYEKIVGGFQPFLQDLLATTGESIERTVAESGAAVRGEITKTAMVDKTVEEGLESYRQQQALRNRAQDLQEALAQPATTCQALATSTNLPAAAQDGQVRVFNAQAKVMSELGRNTSTVQKLEEAHQRTNQNFCSPEEAARNVCAASGATKYAKLAGADSDAAFLFQGTDGSSSYEGLDNSGQVEAAEGYIKRTVGGVPPEQLRDRGEAYYARNPQARAYVELQRRYNAMLSMASYSLAQIQEAHRTKAGLGRDTMMANVSAAGFKPAKYDMSMSEVVERFVATKFSPDWVRDLSRAINPNLILRDMLQMNSFQLWMSYEAMLASSRTEGLTAHQLALVAEQTMRPQIEAQRAAATRAGGAGQ